MIQICLDGNVAFIEKREVWNIGDSIGLAELRTALLPHRPLHRRDQLALHLLVGVGQSLLLVFPNGPFGHLQQSGIRSDGLVTFSSS